MMENEETEEGETEEGRAMMRDELGGKKSWCKLVFWFVYSPGRELEGRACTSVMR